MEKQNPVFVKIDEYKDVLDIMDLIRNKVSEAKAIMGKITELKNQEDTELEYWSSELADIERKLDYMDKNLFEPENI
jgi:hypothetical protein